LASLDEGWYGRGIYFTSSAKYAIPYYGTKKEPAVLIALVIPGSIFPVTEGKSSKTSLQGSSLKAGYGSHYVHTLRSGEVCTQKMEDNYYDELVISQESQIMPIFLLTVNKKSVLEQVELWQAREGGRSERMAQTKT